MADEHRQREPQDTPAPSEDDFIAAQAVLSATPAPGSPAPGSPAPGSPASGNPASSTAGIPTPGTAEYDRKLAALARYRAKVGGDRFDLIFSRRLPRTGLERLHQRSHQESWSEERFEEELRAHAGRAIDEEMFDHYTDTVEDRIHRLSGVIGIITQAATDQRDPDRPYREHDRIDAAVSELEIKFDLFPEEILTVNAFLTELRAEHAEPVRCGGFVAEHAHKLALDIVKFIKQHWSEVADIAGRSRLSPEYARATSAAELIHTTMIQPEKLPGCQQLLSLIRLERTGAKRALSAQRERDGEPTPSRVEVCGIAPHVIAGLKQSLDGEEMLEWAPASAFSLELASRVRQAAQPGRKTKRVRKNVVDGVTLYCLNDIRRFWRDDLPVHLRYPRG